MWPYRRSSCGRRRTGKRGRALRFATRSRHTLLYGTEVKFYSQRVKLSENLETEIEGLYIIGDGAGITRGLLQASASGIIAAQDATKRM